MATRLDTPNINYKSIKINNKNIVLGEKVRASFVAPYNRIDIVMQPVNCSLSYYEVRVTKSTVDWDIGVGNLAYWDANISLQEDKNFSIPINSEIFDEGDGDYRISLYGRSAIDGSWDVTYLLFTVEEDKFIPIDASGFEVLTTRNTPAD